MSGTTTEALLATELCRFGSNQHSWRIADAVEGTQIFGATGSGKTTGSGRHIALAMLRAGFGGLVLTAKTEELRTWKRYVTEAGREDSLLIVSPEEDRHFNFLDYEWKSAKRARGLTQNLVSLFCSALESDAAGRSGASDPYWEHALRQLLTNAIDTVGLAHDRVTLSDIVKTILSAPTSVELANDEKFLEKSFCAQAMKKAAQRTDLSEDQRHDWQQCRDYWLADFAALADRTRSSIVSSFTSRATGLLRGRLRRIFCSDSEANFRPEHSHAGRVIILDLPVKEFGDYGRFAQILFKTIWQRATERRNVREAGQRPVFLWADEAQHFITTEDMLFQQTARSSLAATVYLSQNISNYYAVMGGRDSRAATDSFLGNLQTKIFHNNSDPATNEWSERLFGRKQARVLNRSLNLSLKQSNDGSIGVSGQPQEQARVHARLFTKLRRGRESQGVVDAIIYHAGKYVKQQFSLPPRSRE